MTAVHPARVLDRQLFLASIRNPTRELLEGGRAAVLSDAGRLADLDAVLSSYRGLRVTAFVAADPHPARVRPPNLTVVPTLRPARIATILAAAPPLDLIVDWVSQPGRHRPLHRLLGHVRPGGRYVLGSNFTSTADPHPGADVAADPEIAGLLDRVDADATSLVLWRAGEVAVKLRHREVELLARASTGRRWSRVLHRVPPETVSTAHVVGFDNDPARRAQLYPDVVEVPELVVREYLEVDAHPYGVLRKDHLVLPDTFRRWQARRLVNGKLPGPSAHFSAAAPAPRTRLPGQYYYLDLEYPLHFGHFLTEAVGRLWDWPRAKTANPDLKLVVGRLLPFQAEILSAFGVRRDDIVVLDRPTRLESVVAAMPGFHIGGYASPVLADTYARIRAGLPEVDGPREEKLFVLRAPGLWRACVNATEVERFFAERGFAVRRPSDHGLAQQAAMFRHARVVASYNGSQLYGQLFGGPCDLVTITGRHYPSNNEFLLSGVLGQTLHQFWCDDAPGRQVDATGRPLNAAHTDFRSDFAADGRSLSRLLDRLDR